MISAQHSPDDRGELRHSVALSGQGLLAGAVSR